MFSEAPQRASEGAERALEGAVRSSEGAERASEAAKRPSEGAGWGWGGGEGGKKGKKKDRGLLICFLFPRLTFEKVDDVPDFDVESSVDCRWAPGKVIWNRLNVQDAYAVEETLCVNVET